MTRLIQQRLRKRIEKDYDHRASVFKREIIGKKKIRNRIIVMVYINGKRTRSIIAANKERSYLVCKIVTRFCFNFRTLLKIYRFNTFSIIET